MSDNYDNEEMATRRRDSGQSRVPLTPWTAVLVVGDVLALVAFVTVGALEHNIDPTAFVGRMVGTVTPFVLGWLAVALVGGLYRREATASLRNAVLWTLPAWVVAVLVAQALRSTSYFPGNAPPSFVLVSLFFGGLFIHGWRVLATLLGGQFEKR